MNLSKAQIEILQILREEDNWIRFFDVDSRKDLYPLVDAGLASRLPWSSASEVGYRITDKGRQKLSEIEEDTMSGVYAEDLSLPTEKIMKAEELFEHWWRLFGKPAFEEELDIKPMRKEIMSYVFLAGYIAGYNKMEAL